MSLLRVAAAALLAGAAAWVSQGTLGFATPDGGRIGVLPISLLAAGLSLLAVAFVIALARRGASLAPVALLVLPIIPWLPLPLPDVALMWAGRIALLVWCAVVLGMLASLPGHVTLFIHSARVAGITALVVYAVAAWSASPMRPGGDEPHYLVITQSLLLDRDVKIENNHRRRDYRAYFAGELPPDFVRRGRDGEIYSIHAPGISALVAPVFAVAGYRGVVIFLVCLAAAGSALAWHLAWMVTGRHDAAWFGWAAATLSTTAIFQSFAVYPDGVGALIVLTGIWGILRAAHEPHEQPDDRPRAMPWLWHGAALALLPWLHTRFAVLAGTLGALLLLRLSTTREPVGKAVAFLAVPAVSALGWIAYFVAIYGTPDPSAPYGTSDIGSLAYVTSGISGILFDQRFGVLAYSPVLAFAFGGLVAMLWRPGHRRLALELLFVAIPYTLAFSNYAMWWGGASAPARFFMPLVPALAIPAAVGWTAIARRGTRATAIAALMFSLAVAAIVVFAADGRLAFNARDGLGQWLEWLSPGVHLGQGVPVWFRRGDPTFFRRAGDAIYLRDVGIWVSLFIGAWLLVRRAGAVSALRNRGALFAATIGVFAIAAMLGVVMVWALHGATGIAAAEGQMALLHRVSTEPRFVAFALEPPSLLGRDHLAGSLRIESAAGSARGCAGRNDRPLFSLPGLPAGRYRLRVRAQAASGLLLVGIGCDQFSLLTEALAAPPRPIEMNFPVDVRRLLVRGDEEARQAAKSLTIEPLTLVPANQRLTSASARHGVRYGTASVFFIDDGLFAEPESFWVRGARDGAVVVQPDVSRSTTTLLLRNAPVANTLRIETGNWREELTLAAGEERRVQVPLDTARGATLIRFSASSGFHPSDVDPGSRDGRFLGVWVKIE